MLSLLPSAAARAGAYRDDRDPQLYLGLAGRPEYASVGQLDISIFAAGQAAVGSGTLVAPGWVLTAAHVVEDARFVQFEVNGEVHDATRWVSHPKYVYRGDLRRGYDLALVQLDAPVTTVTPAKIYRGHKEANGLGVFVGVGKSGTGLTGVTADDGLKRAGTNAIDGVVRTSNKGLPKIINKLGRDARTFAVDFDNPYNPADSTMGSATPTELEYLIAPGDSGGSAFIDFPNDTDGPLLIGIHSFGEIFDALDDSDYGDITGHTRVSKYGDWIDRVIAGRAVGRSLQFVTPIQTDPSPPLDMLSLPAANGRLNVPDGFGSTGGVPEPGATSVAFIATLGLLARRRSRR